MATLIFEILTEDIPANLQIKAESDIKQLFITSFTKYNLTYSKITAFSTPRRIAILVENLLTDIADITVEKKGPAKTAGEKALLGFLNSNNLQLSDCIIKATEKGEFYFANLITKGGKLVDKLPNILIDEILSQVSFKTSMFWNNTKIKWARPITGLVLMLDDKVINFEYAGVKSNNKIFGHRFLSTEVQELNNAADYIKVIEKLNVILASNDSVNLENLPTRENIILNEVSIFANKHNIVANTPKSLIDELVYLVEYPVVLFAEIPEKYLALPKELLVTIMVKNQRYINFFNSDGSISKHFAIVSNLKASDNGLEIIKGNQKVLNARLEDGLFFYNLDLKVPLSAKVDNLKKINYFEQLGSLFDKQERVKGLAEKLFNQNDLIKITTLYKADLVSEVVKEMPELQGIMGGYYGEKEGLNSEQSLAIKDQYKPNGASDNVPSNLLGAKLALLDKLDTLISFNSIGKMPSGSGDPFGLRRAALGIIRISIEYKININLANILNQELQNFLLDRLEVYIKSLNINPSLIKALVSQNNIENKSTVFNINEIYQKVVILNEFLLNNSDLLALYKRIFKIVTTNQIENSYKFKQELLIEPVEQQLFKVYTQIAPKVEEALVAQDYKLAIENLITIKIYLDAFLDNILIVDKNNSSITNNRLLLLNMILNLLQQLAHFDLIS
ncbi:glycine--tRNA ligase subunit beta [Rickettsiales bacterium LUAb2]